MTSLGVRVSVRVEQNENLTRNGARILFMHHRFDEHDAV